MARLKKRPAPLCKAVTGPSLNIPMKLASLKTEDSASLNFRQAPIGAVRLARRFGLSVATAAAVVEANGWGRA